MLGGTAILCTTVLLQTARTSLAVGVSDGGDALMNRGLFIPFERDYESCVIELESTGGNK